MIKRFVYNKFDGIYKPTTKSREYKNVIINGKNHKLIINDIFGYDKINAWIADLTSKCDGFLLVFSLSKIESFEAVTRVINMIQSIKKKKASELPILVVGNKKDNENIKVSDYELEQLTRKFNVEIVKVSALTGENVELVFTKLVEKFNLCNAKVLHKNMKMETASYCGCF